MSQPNIPSMSHAMAALLLLAGACGPVPTYARLEAAGGEAGSGGAADSDGGTPSGGVGTGGMMASSGGHASGGAVGTGGRADTGSGGVATGGASPATGGASPATGGASPGTGGVSSGTGGVSPRTGGAPAATGGASSGGGGSVGTGGSKTATGGSSPGTGGAPAATGGTGPTDGGAMVPADPSKYGFEGSVQGWGMAGGGSAWSGITCSNAFSFAGMGALAASVAAQASMTYILEVAPPTPAIPPGTTVSFHLRLPSTAMLNAIQAYVMETGTYRFTATRVAGSNLARNTWVKVDVTVPSDAAAILRLGVQFESSGTWTDTVYLDAIDW